MDWVWYNLTNDESAAAGWLSEQIVHNLWEEMNIKLKEPCRSNAEVGFRLLYSIYPVS